MKRTWSLYGAAAVVAVAALAACTSSSSGSGSTTASPVPKPPVTSSPPIAPSSSAVTSPSAPTTSASPQTVGATDLLSAPVPPLCGHPAGTLFEGQLPGVPSGQGAVGLKRSYTNGRVGAYLEAFGDLDGDGARDAAAVLTCNAGGTGVPDTIAFYAPGPRLLGSFAMDSVAGGARDGTESIRYDNGAIVARSVVLRSAEPECCASGMETVTLQWDGAKIVANSVTPILTPTDITFTGIGKAKLGMSAAQLRASGYTAQGAPDVDGCEAYSDGANVHVNYDPVTDRAVQIFPSFLSGFHTAIGGVTEGTMVSDVERAYVHYSEHKYFTGHFDSNANGVVVDGPGGSIAFELGPGSADAASGVAGVVGIVVAAPGFTGVTRPDCT